MRVGENFVTAGEIKVKVKENSSFRCVSSSLSTSPSLYGTNMSGQTVIVENNIVVIPANTLVKVENRLIVRIKENTQVLLTAGENLDITGASWENVPANWMQDAENHRWTAIGDNTLAPGSSLQFPVSLKAPKEAGTYTFYVTTTDTAGIVIDTPVQITVDNAAPSLTISVSPSWVKGGVEVTVTVKGNEPFTFDNVFVAENNVENVPLTMTPNADNTEWTGTYTTGENESRDGWATITVVNAKDELGNSTTVSDSTKLFIDRRKPGKPDLTAMGFPSAWDYRSSFVINKIFDNTDDNLAVVPSGYSPENMKLVILVDNVEVATLTAGPTGRVSYALTLSDGKHVVGAYFVDKAGNKGEENLENVVIDNNKPTITFVFPAENGQYIRDNKPTIRVIIADTVGVENNRVIDGIDDNDGYRVDLCYENGAVWLENLVPSADPTQTDNVAGRIVFTTFTFENILPIELPDNTYILRVIVGDNFRLENVSIRFTVDTKAPNPPANLVGSITAGTLDNPTGTKTRTFTLRGTAEPDATIKVYITTDGGVTWTEVTASRITAGADGSWLTQIDLSAYAGRNIGIAVTATDRAGNESDRTLYGYLIYDASAPRVTITSPQTGAKTSKTSIQVTGTVTKDSWEEWSDIILTIQVGTGSVTLPVFGTGDTANFSYSVALAEGTNTIMVIVSDGMNSSYDSVTVTRTVTPWGTYAVVLVIIALILAAIAILRVKK
ncbi:MAG: Ig-like domain-containing protein [Candidatus Hadarchaeales archaeon]